MSLASDNVDGRLDDVAYLERKRELLDEIAALERSAKPGIGAGRAVEWLKALSQTWQASDVLEEKADLLHAIYDRIVVAGERIVSVRLTPKAEAHGMALALPQRWRGLQRSSSVGCARTSCDPHKRC